MPIDPTDEDGQERLAQGPCAVAFSQRRPAAIVNVHTGPDWAEFTQVLLAEEVCAALNVPVELDGGVIGTLDVYAADPRDWDPSEVTALQAYAAAGAARSSTRRLADVARDVTDGQRLPADRRKRASARAGQAKDPETAS